MNTTHDGKHASLKDKSVSVRRRLRQCVPLVLTLQQWKVISIRCTDLP